MVLQSSCVVLLEVVMDSLLIVLCHSSTTDCSCMNEHVCKADGLNRLFRIIVLLVFVAHQTKRRLFSIIALLDFPAALVGSKIYSLAAIPIRLIRSVEM